MLSYVVRRLLIAIPTLLIIIVVSFFMMRIAPGGPFDVERQLPAQIEANIAARYNLDQPLVVQFGIYMWNVLQFDFGPSIKLRDFTVTELISQGFPASLMLGGIALVLSAMFGIAAGCWAALRQNSGTDYAVMTVSMTGIAVPNFVMAPLLTLFFGLWLAWLPVGGWVGWEAKILPIIALALPQVGYFARLTRASMIETLRSNFIRTAHAKGLPPGKVVTRHALKGALLPAVSYMGPAAAGLITGSIVIEQIFGIPGIGRYFVQSALNRDYPVVMGTVIVYSALIILLNLMVDMIYSWLDPKVRYD
jgi:oligopeptide transport system permease protein